jgi:RNA polymerase sigma factor (TIGR02999 family)
MTPSPTEITQLLVRWREGDETALDKLIPLVYTELRRLAGHYMHQERPGHTLQTSALINEAYLRLIDHKNINWENRAHFFGVAAQAMRRVLVDYARSRRYIKRGGDVQMVPLDEAALVSRQKAADLVALDDALASLARIDPRKSRVVELRYFGGLSVEEAAEVLGISQATVMREWSTAKAWLLRAVSECDHDNK